MYDPLTASTSIIHQNGTRGFSMILNLTSKYKVVQCLTDTIKWSRGPAVFLPVAIQSKPARALHLQTQTNSVITYDHSQTHDIAAYLYTVHAPCLVVGCVLLFLGLAIFGAGEGVAHNKTAGYSWYKHTFPPQPLHKTKAAKCQVFTCNRTRGYS